MKPLAPGTLRARLYHLTSVNGTWGGPPGSTMDRMRRGLPVTLSRETVAACISPGDLAARGIDLGAAESWTLTGPDTLTPAV